MRTPVETKQCRPTTGISCMLVENEQFQLTFKIVFCTLYSSLIQSSLGTSCLGYELTWVRVGIGYEMSWVRVGHGYELTWVRVGKVRLVLGTS